MSATFQMLSNHQEFFQQRLLMHQRLSGLVGRTKYLEEPSDEVFRIIDEVKSEQEVDGVIDLQLRLLAMRRIFR